MRILLADDDEDIREVAAMLFAARGFDVTTVASGVEAERALVDGVFDVAVLDANMAPGSGLEVVVARRAAGDATSMLLWTAWTGVVSRDEAARLDLRLVNKTDVHDLLRTVSGLPSAG